MAKVKKPNRQAFWCSCHSPDHLLIMEIDEWPDQKELMIYYRLSHFRGFWGRCLNALKYIFKRDVSRVDYVDMILSDIDDLEKMKSMIDEVIEYQKLKKPLD